MDLRIKKIVIVLVSVLMTVLILTALRAHFPLKNLFGLIEARWGYSAVIGLQSGLGALMGILAARTCK